MKAPSLLLIGLLMIFAGGPATTAQTPDSRTALEQGVCAFKNKNYRLAETEFEKGSQQDPANKLLLLFTARAIDFQVEPKDSTAGNLAMARSAIDAYLKLLAADPADAEAVSSIVRLYEQIDATKLADIAANEATPKQVRTAIFIKLAAAGNTCANDITDANKTESSNGYRYHMPKNPKDLASAKACSADGMKFIDRALALDSENESAWSYKASLSIQMSRLAEMQQQIAEKARLDKEAQAARTEFRKLADAERVRRDKADRDEEERASKEKTTDADGAVRVGKFISSGRLTTKVRIDQNSIDPRDLYLLSPPDDAERQPKPDPSPAPIVWKTVMPTDGTFSFMLPSPFDLDRKLYFAKGEGMSFLLTYIDIPPDHPPATAEQIMAGAALGLADGVCTFSLMAQANCYVRLSKKTSFGSYPGLEYTIVEDNCIKVYPGLLRVYATPNRVYALAVIGGDETDPRAAKFLSSLAIKK